MGFGVVKSLSTHQISRASLRFVSRESNTVNHITTKANEISNLDPSLLPICAAVSSAEMVFRSVKHSHDLPEASVSNEGGSRR